MRSLRSQLCETLLKWMEGGNMGWLTVEHKYKLAKSFQRLAATGRTDRLLLS